MTDVQSLGGGGGGIRIQKGQRCLLSRVQIHDSGLTEGVDDKMSLILAVKIYFWVHLNK